MLVYKTGDLLSLHISSLFIPYLKNIYNYWKMVCSQRKRFPTGASITYVGEREETYVGDKEWEKTEEDDNSWSAEDGGRESGREQKKRRSRKERRRGEESRERGINSMEKRWLSIAWKIWGIKLDEWIALT